MLIKVKLSKVMQGLKDKFIKRKDPQEKEKLLQDMVDLQEKEKLAKNTLKAEENDSSEDIFQKLNDPQYEFLPILNNSLLNNTNPISLTDSLFPKKPTLLTSLSNTDDLKIPTSRNYLEERYNPGFLHIQCKDNGMLGKK